MLALHVDFGVPTIWAGDAPTAANIAERILTRVFKQQIERAKEFNVAIGIE